MQHLLAHIAPREIVKGFLARIVHTDHVTLSFVEVEAGAVLPEHAHFHEQTTQVLEGQFELKVEGQTHLCEPGALIVISPHAKHSGIAITPCKIMDVFSPVREDYKW